MIDSDFINTLRPVMRGQVYVLSVGVEGYPDDTFRVSGTTATLDFTVWRRQGDGWRQFPGVCRHKYDMFDAIATDEKTKESPDE